MRSSWILFAAGALACSTTLAQDSRWYQGGSSVTRCEAVESDPYYARLPMPESDAASADTPGIPLPLPLPDEALGPGPAGGAASPQLAPPSSPVTSGTGATGSVFSDTAYNTYGSGGYGSGGGGYGGGSGYGGGGYGASCLPAVCDECPKRGLIAFVAYDSWRGVADGNWQNNGIRTGVNFGTRLGKISDWTGIGAQVGGSVTSANWPGTDYRAVRQTDSEVQGFFTYGIFRKANENSHWSAALVEDWMFNDNFGVYAVNPTITQWRGQVAYATSALNEFGVWGTFRGNESTVNTVSGPGTFRAVNQLSGFWHYKWPQSSADSTIWIGVPEHDRLLGAGSLGDYFVGAAASVPLSDRWAMNVLVSYMHQSAAPGPAAAEEDSWNFSVEMAYFPARNARTKTVAGQCWMPMLPVANNGLFMVDSNKFY